MRVLACVLAALTLAGPAGGSSTGLRVAFVHGGDLVVLDLATRERQVVLRDAPLGPVAWSGDGTLLSDGGTVVGGPALPTSRIAWAPDGETAAYQTSDGALHIWTPEHAGLDLYANGTVKPIASLTTTVGTLSQAWEPNDYGHYGWPQLLAVSA